MREVREAFRRFWPLTRGDRKWLVVIVGCVVVSALAETASILLFAQLTDTALKAGSLSAFWGPAGAWLAVAALGALGGYLGNSLATWTAERFVLRLRAKVFRHVQDLPPQFSTPPPPFTSVGTSPSSPSSLRPFSCWPHAVSPAVSRPPPRTSGSPTAPSPPSSRSPSATSSSPRPTTATATRRSGSTARPAPG